MSHSTIQYQKRFRPTFSPARPGAPGKPGDPALPFSPKTELEQLNRSDMLKHSEAYPENLAGQARP